MYKRIGSMVLSVALVLGNVSGLEMEAVSDSAEECIEEVNAVTGDVPEEEEQEWICIDGVIYVPEGITRIEERELSGIGGEGWFPGAKKIVLPSTLEYIGVRAFEMCELEEIVIPKNAKEIGGYAFAHSQNLKTVIFEGDSIEKIGGSLFWYCETLETVVLPEKVGEWDTDFAFMSCYKLKNVTIPQEGMDRLGTGMFYACESLEEFIIPDCVTTMNYDVFTCCNSLKLLKAGYNVVNFEDGGYNGCLNISLGCFGTGYYDTEHVWHSGPANMVLEAPLDSAIVEYARYYRYFTVKYDYPDFERVEYSCDGEILVNPDYSTNKYGWHKYLIYFDFDIYPKNSDSHVEVERLTYNTFKTKEDSPIREYDYIYRTWQPDGVNYYSMQERIAIRMDGEWEDGNYPEMRYMPTVEYFKMKCYSQGENFEDELVDEKYFKVVLTKQSFEEKRIQIEILTSGEWDSEDAQWELITSAIDTKVLTPVPTQAPQATPTVTTGPTMEPTKVPEPTKLFQQDKEIVPVATEKITPTPTVKVKKPAKVSLKSAKQLTVKKQGKKTYKREVKLSWKKAKNADGYVVYMKSGKGKYKAVKTITNGKTVSYTRKNLKRGKTYYFKVRAYRKVNGQKVYGNYSGAKKVKIK